MKQLLKDSVTILEKSKEKYNNAITAIDKSTSQLKVFANKITSMTTKNTEEHKAWTGKVRAAVYGTNGAVSVGLIFADIFGCLGKSWISLNSIQVCEGIATKLIKPHL